MKKIIILIFVLLGVGINAKAQEKSNKELRGDKHYFVYSFDEAILCYNRADQLSVEGQRKLAESYHNLNQNVKSEEAYSKLVTMQSGVLPEDHYHYAGLLKMNGKYSESDKAMDVFVSLKPNDLRSKDYIANKSEFANLLNDDGQYKIITQTVNTTAEDLAPSYYKNKIVFASSRAKPKMIVKNSNWTGNPYYNIYVSETENGQLKNPEIFNKDLNGKMHDGPVSFSKDGNYMAFTSNNYDLDKQDKVVQLGIYFSTYVDEKWSESQAFQLNSKSFSIGHPCLSADGKTMYFTSDMPGGYGGADIYRVLKSGDGKWGKAENMGDKINTEGDEMFPFFEENSHTLFFSSDGRFGLGGLDVFTCEIHASGPERAYNVGTPMNTRFDDYAAIVNETMTQGYFTSNRSTGSGSEDIYAFNLEKTEEIKHEIQGIAKDQNENPIPATFITLRDDKGKILQTVTTKENATFIFLVEPDKNYVLRGTKEKYTDGESSVNTFGEQPLVVADVVLTKKEQAPIKVVEKEDDVVKLLGLKNIYFDFGKSDLRPEAVVELDKIVKLMNENPNMVVELSAYTDCRSSKSYNQNLSDRRAKVPAWYIKTRITNPDRITGKGYGESRPVNQCPCDSEVVSECSEEEHQTNRRTEFIIISNTNTAKLHTSISQNK